MFDTLCEVDTKFAKLVDNECEEISTDVKKWFKRLAVRHDSSMLTILIDLTLGMVRRRRSVNTTQSWPLIKERLRMPDSITRGKSRRTPQMQLKNTIATLICLRPLGKTPIKKNSMSFNSNIAMSCLSHLLFSYVVITLLWSHNDMKLHSSA